VLSFLKNGKIDSYWGISGSMTLLGDLTTSSRAFQISSATSDLSASFISSIDSQLSLKSLLKYNADAYYYSLAVQAGYLTFKKVSNDEFRLKIPNYELQNVWENYMETEAMKQKNRDLTAISTNPK
jgi:hypothetical protein